MTRTKSVLRKALVPVAGRGTRLAPLTRVVPKALFPLVNSSGLVRAVLHVILEQATRAGVEQIGIVVSPEHRKMLQQYVDSAKECDAGELAAAHVEFIVQPRPRGFGDAVLRGADFVGDEPFMLLLGDHLYLSNRNQLTCAEQVIRAFNTTGGVAVVGVQPAPAGELSKVGVARGVSIRGRIYQCTDFVEKPDLQVAKDRLITSGMPPDTFLAHCGIYVFTPDIFRCLSSVGRAVQTAGRAEVELAEAQTMLLNSHSEEYFLVKISGRAYDVGTPAGYARACAVFRQRG
ncbi:MAG: NTP transferase domain-containing protein [Phycisphaerales bacterium]|nr:MAG: NTP transferase domain-containing protein [Phycisphaerales bacterium]